MSFFSKKPAGQPADETHAAARARSFRRGAFSAGATALAVAAVIVFNLLAGQLPDSVSQFDMTDSGIYNITETSVSYLAELRDDVEIHVLADRDSVDSRIVRFLSKYEALSDHLSVEYIDPTVHPAVKSTYGVEGDTVVITCEATGRQESFAIDDIIGYDVMSYYYYGNYNETDFDAEGLLTSAIDGVLTESARMVYQTTGHGETALADEITELMRKSHLSVDSVNLMTDGGIPADCDLLILVDPTRDLADDELSALLDYLASGGQVVYFMAGQDLDLPNFESLCAAYGMTVAGGLIADTQRYYQNTPYLFFPEVVSSVDATADYGSDAMLLFYSSRGMTITDPARDTITVSSFLNTSEGGVAVTAEGEQTPGVYSVAAVATEAIDDGITARLTVYGSDSPINTSLTGNATNLDNTGLFMASVTCGFEDISSVSIDPVSLSEPVNTVTTGGIWGLVFIFIIPIGALIFGLIRWMRRRRL